MQYRILRRVVLSFAVVIVAAGSLTLLGCGGDDEPDVRAVNASIPLNATRVQAVQGQAFAFPSGAAFGVAGPTTLTFTSNTTFALTSGGSTSTGNVAFGSCTLTVTGPATGGLRPVGTVLSFPTCNIQVVAAAVTQGDNVGAQGSVTLVLTGATSSPITLTIVLLEDGVIVINNINTGVVNTGTSGG